MYVCTAYETALVVFRVYWTSRKDGLGSKVQVYAQDLYNRESDGVPS